LQDGWLAKKLMELTMLPTSILRIWFIGLISLAILGGAVYLAWDWYRYDRDDQQLYWAIGLGTIACLGRFAFWPVTALGGGPPTLTSVRETRLTRPDGTAIHVNILREGSGPAVILTHGWSLNSSLWGYAQSELPKNCELIAWDLRGLGRSSKSPTNDYSLEAMSGDLLEVSQLAGERNVILVGHSIGGMICQTFARLYPDQLERRVTDIVLVDTTFTNPLKTATLAPLWLALQKPLIEPLLHLTVWLSPLVWLMNLQSYFNGTTQMTTRFTSFAGQQTWGQIDFVSRLSTFASPAVVARGMLAMLKFDATDALPSIGVPMMVLAGDNDRLTRREASEYLAAHAPKGSLQMVDSAGHLGLLEQHGAFNAKIAQMAARLGKLGSDARASA
jgi:pimeloyl-ACP methyl ester carboxylesterase